MELVEPEDLDLKEEKVEANMREIKETGEDVPLIGDDGEIFYTAGCDFSAN